MMLKTTLTHDKLAGVSYPKIEDQTKLLLCLNLCRILYNACKVGGSDRRVQKTPVDGLIQPMNELPAMHRRPLISEKREYSAIFSYIFVKMT